MKFFSLTLISRLVAVLCAIVLAACDPTLDDVAQTDNPSDLVTIATEVGHEDYEVGEAALKKLVLAGEIQALEQVAVNANLWGVRRNAIGFLALHVAEITDENILAEIAKGTGEASFRVQAIAQLTDPMLLMDIAKQVSADMRQAAINRIENQDLLYEVVKDKKTRADLLRTVLGALLKKTQDQSVFMEFAPQISNREHAQIVGDRLRAGFLTDSGHLSTLVETASSKSVKFAAVRQLSDQTKLVELVLNLSEAELAYAALDAIKTPAALERVALESRNPYFRKQALEGLMPHVSEISNAEILVRIAKITRSGKTGRAAVARISDPERLLEIAEAVAPRQYHGTFYVSAVLERINDQDLLNSIARDRARNMVIRTAAVEHIAYSTRLVQLTKTADPDIKGAAWRRLAALASDADEQTLIDMSTNVAPAGGATGYYPGQDFVLKLSTRMGGWARKDKSVLAQIVTQSPNTFLRENALTFVESPQLLASIATDKDQVLRVRRTALFKIKDAAVHRQLAAADKNPQIRYEAAKSLVIANTPWEHGYFERHNVPEQLVWLQLIALDAAIAQHYGPLSLSYRERQDAFNYTGGSTLFVQHATVELKNNASKRVVGKTFSGDRPIGVEKFVNGAKTNRAKIEIGGLCTQLLAPLSDTERASLRETTRNCFGQVN